MRRSQWQENILGGGQVTGNERRGLGNTEKEMIGRWNGFKIKGNYTDQTGRHNRGWIEGESIILVWKDDSIWGIFNTSDQRGFIQKTLCFLNILHCGVIHIKLNAYKICPDGPIWKSPLRLSHEIAFYFQTEFISQDPYVSFLSDRSADLRCHNVPCNVRFFHHLQKGIQHLNVSNVNV